MNYRRFGRIDWQVSEIGYGMWGMAGWTGSDDDESLASLQLSIDLGCNFYDTAWGYGEGHSESLLGQIIRANPDKKLYTATKIPPKNWIWPSRREFTLDDCFPPDHIEKYAHSSLENSGLESFDLMQFHFLRPTVIFYPAIFPDMELHQVETLQPRILQTAVDILFDVVGWKTIV